ncbi:MAG: DsbA family protein [Pseudanabaenaceae cyanobacterium]
MSKFLNLCLVVLFIPLLVLLSGCSAEVSALTDSQLEAKVLDIIRRHPQVILESVEAFNRNRQEQARIKRDEKLRQMGTNPASIIGNSPVTGAKDRKIVMVEFSDFQCPFCARAHGTVQEFMSKYGNEVTLTYKHLPLTRIHPQALPAALAAWSAQQQGKFWEYHDRLFTRQNELGEQLYLELAKELALNTEKFNQDRQSQQAQSAVNQDIALATELGINGTPAFYINGIEISGAVPLEVMESALQQAKANLPKS